MDLINTVLNEHGQNHHLLHNSELRGEFLSDLRAALTGVVEEFYERRLLEKSGGHSGVWGDKTPGYADPKLSPGCLSTINELFPNARFIHILRSPLAVVTSLVTKRWATHKEAADIWGRIGIEARRLGERIGKERFLEISYEDLYRDGENQIDAIVSFLGLERESTVTDFIRGQSVSRTRISNPVSNLDNLGEGDSSVKMTEEQIALLHQILGMDLHSADSALLFYQQRGSSGGRAECSEQGSALSSVIIRGVKREECSGELDVRIRQIEIDSDRASLGKGGVLTVSAGEVLNVGLWLECSRAVENILVGYLIESDDGVCIGGQNSLMSGVASVNLEAGAEKIIIAWEWPKLPAGRFSVTFGIGEGTHPTNHVRQCWVQRALLCQSPDTQTAGGDPISFPPILSMERAQC